MFQNNLMAGAAGQGGFYDYQIDQSLRFNDNDSAYLSRTPASASNRRTWTWSGWVKRGNLGTRNALFEVRVNGTNFCSLVLDENNRGRIYSIISAIDYGFTSNDVFRDTSSWYHFVWVMDTTNATSSDRSRLYVNNRRITSFSTNYGEFPLNYEPLINTTSGHNIGLYVDSGTYFDGYMAEVNFIDGQALDPTDFGQFKSDIWIPKEYTGSYGTNGFYLTFEDSASIGDDLSGNANDWTPNNLASTDVMLDSPTNNFAALSPLTGGSPGPLSDGNLYIDFNAYPASGAAPRSTIGMPSGKWYWEVTQVTTSQNALAVGIHGHTKAGNVWTDNHVFYYGSQGYFYENSTGVVYGSGFTTGDVIGVALNADDSEITFYKNGVSQGTKSITLTPESGSWFASLTQGSTGAGNDARINFGQLPFAYTPPTDFLPLNSTNLPAPTIDPAEDSAPSDYFNTVLWTGTGSAQPITVGFQPDLVWIKARGEVAAPRLVDSVRGVDKVFYSSSTSAEVTEDGVVDSFDSDGFTGGGANAVTSGFPAIAWNWLAGNGTSTNTDGSITSTVSVNQKSGFSIVGWTGTGGGADTIGHGLGAPPKMVITKTRTASVAYNWNTYHVGLDPVVPEDYFIALNTTAARGAYTTADLWNRTQPTSSVFSVNHPAAAGPLGDAMIAYCFAEVEGFSKFGSYTGNGSTDGPFVYCGFRPAFVVVKRVNSTGSWYIHDKLRAAEYNPQEEVLLAEASNAAQFFGDKDFVSNGFKIRDTASGHNTSGGTYIFMAFAEQPFKYANAR